METSAGRRAAKVETQKMPMDANRNMKVPVLQLVDAEQDVPAPVLQQLGTVRKPGRND